MWKLLGEVWELSEKCEAVREVWKILHEGYEESVSAIWKGGKLLGKCDSC